MPYLMLESRLGHPIASLPSRPKAKTLPSRLATSLLQDIAPMATSAGMHTSPARWLFRLRLFKMAVSQQPAPHSKPGPRKNPVRPTYIDERHRQQLGRPRGDVTTQTLQASHGSNTLFSKRFKLRSNIPPKMKTGLLHTDRGETTMAMPST